jgi:hypothetical protein
MTWLKGMLGPTLCSIQSFEPVSLRRTGRGLRTRGPGHLRSMRPTLSASRPLRLCPAQNGGRLRAPGRGDAARAPGRGDAVRAPGRGNAARAPGRGDAARAPGRGSAAGGAAGGRGADSGSRLAELAARFRDGRGAGGVAQGRAGGGGQEGWRRQSGPGGLVLCRSVHVLCVAHYCRSLDVVG